VDWENDKPTVVALREIAEDYIGPSILEEKPEPEPEFAFEVDTNALQAEMSEAPAPIVPQPGAED
jgi:hypothetical protein